MSRGLTTAAAEIVTSEVARRCIAVALEFSSGTVRLNSAPYAITLDGNEFLGAGGLGRISVVQESSDLAAYNLTLGLAGIPRDMVAVALTENYQNRKATVWDVPMDADFQPVADPIVIFRGRMDAMSIAMGESAEIVLTLSNRLADWGRPRVIRYSDEDQQRLHSGDFGFQYAAAMVEKEITWPNRQWFTKHA